MFTKEEAAKARGIDTTKIDYALPQMWVDDVRAIVGGEPAAHFVWSYEPIYINGQRKPNIWGFPRAVTEEGDRILDLLPQNLSYRIPS